MAPLTLDTQGVVLRRTRRHDAARSRCAGRRTAFTSRSRGSRSCRDVMKRADADEGLRPTRRTSTYPHRSGDVHVHHAPLVRPRPVVFGELRVGDLVRTPASTTSYRHCTREKLIRQTLPWHGRARASLVCSASAAQGSLELDPSNCSILDHPDRSACRRRARPSPCRRDPTPRSNVPPLLYGLFINRSMTVLRALISIS